MARQRTGTLIFKRSAGWCARVWAPSADGAQERRFFQLGTFDKDLAKRKMAKIVAGLASGELVADAREKAGKAETLHEFAEAWLKRREAAKVVMAGDERRHLEAFVLPKFGALTLAQFQSRDADTVLGELVEREYSKETVKKVRATMSRLFGAAWKARIIAENPIARVDMPETAVVDGRERAILTDDEIARFFACATVDTELRVLAVCARILGGMRTSEVIRWSWTSLDREHFAHVSFMRAKAKRGTGGKLQRLAVPEGLRPILKAWWASQGSPATGPVFPARSGANAGGFKASRGTSFALRLRRALLAAGVDRHELHHETETTKPADFHSFRRAFASALAEGGANAQKAMHLTGHTDHRTHELYVMSTPGMREIPADAVPQLSPLVSVPKRRVGISVHPVRFELTTFGFEGRRSIQLS